MTNGGESIGRAVQSGIYRAGAFGTRPKVPVTPENLEKAAHKRMTPQSWAYVAGSAGQQRTAEANRAALDRWQIVPRMLRDVDNRDTSVDLFGRRLHAPFLLGPVGVLEMAHADADLAVARAASGLDLPMIISNQGSVPMEDTARKLNHGQPWFQLYWSRDRDLVASFVSRAEAIGSSAIVVTLDTSLLGWRPWDLDLGSLPFARGQGIAQYTSDPVFREVVRQRVRNSAHDRPAESVKPTIHAVRTLMSMTRRYPGGFWSNLRSPEPRAAVETFLDVFANPALTWDDLTFLRERTSLPIVLKGIQSSDDAAKALDHGVDGLVVSNHGGRQVDGAVGSLDALPAIVHEVADRIPVLFDSGIRSGADAFKALALGARAVLVARPYVYGLALAGSAGVTEVMRHIMAEFDLTMGLSGCATVDDISPDLLHRDS